MPDLKSNINTNDSYSKSTKQLSKISNFDIFRIEKVTNPNLSQTKALFGFTLAEVLITLGIIGVVAALTIPNLMTEMKAKKLKTQFTKSYSAVQQAIRLMEADDVSTDFRTYAGSTRHTTLAKYMTNVTICSNNVGGNATKTPAGCHDFYDNSSKSDDYKYLSKSGTLNEGAFNDGQLMLPSGALIFFDDCPAREGWRGCRVMIDINGIEKPNRLGYDFFAFESQEGTLYPVGGPTTSYRENNDCNLGEPNQVGMTCTQKAVSDSDYFKKVVKMIK